jgi:hypothetical protein
MRLTEDSEVKVGVRWYCGARVLVVRAALFILVLMAVVSLTQGVRNALKDSQDFQYSGARLLLDGHNPYMFWLSGEHAQDFRLSQAPNYGPLLFYLISPIAALDWPSAKATWAALNVLWAFLVAYQLFRGQREGRRYSGIVLALLFLSSLPVRNCIGNGQQALFMLVCMVALLLLIERRVIAGGLLAITLTKYSLGASLWAACAGSRRYAAAFGAITLTLVSFLALAAQSHTSVTLRLFLSVLRVGESGMSLNPLFASLKTLFGHEGLLGVACIGMLACFIVIRRAMNNHSPIDSKDVRQTATVSMSASLIFAPHLGYDYMVLVLPLAVGVVWAALSFPDRIIYGAVLSYEWNLSKLADSISSSTFHWACDLAVYIACVLIFVRASQGFYSVDDPSAGSQKKLSTAAIL